jgi:hypothetical protein
MRLPFCAAPVMSVTGTSRDVGANHQTHVSEHDTIRRVDVERLGLGVSGRTSSRVSDCELGEADGVVRDG